MGNVIEEDPPQRDASAGIYSQVAAMGFELREFGGR
jgi:hypothetical protein